MLFRRSSDDSSPRVVPPPAPSLDATALGRLCGLFFLSRLLILGVAVLSHLVVMRGPFERPNHSLLERFATWDAGWYLSIADIGYTYRADDESSVAFYPLYPMLIRAATRLGADPLLAGYVISHAALFGACVLLWKLAALETRSRETAERAVTFLLFCPGAVWFGMIYTESLFLLTLIGCLFAARRGRWLEAGAWGFAAALTRTPGLLLAGFLALEAAQSWLDGRRANRSLPRLAPEARPAATALLWRPAVGVAGPVLGHLSFLLFLHFAFGDWRAQQKTMSAGWNSSGLRMPWTALVEQWRDNEPFFTAISDPLLAAVVVLGVVGLFTLRRWSYPALVFALVALSVGGTTGESLPRYLSTVAPIYLVMAQLAGRSRLLEITLLAISIALLTLLTLLLGNGYRIM